MTTDWPICSGLAAADRGAIAAAGAGAKAACKGARGSVARKLPADVADRPESTQRKRQAARATGCPNPVWQHAYLSPALVQTHLSSWSPSGPLEKGGQDWYDMSESWGSWVTSCSERSSRCTAQRRPSQRYQRVCSRLRSSEALRDAWHSLSAAFPRALASLCAQPPPWRRCERPRTNRRNRGRVPGQTWRDAGARQGRSYNAEGVGADAHSRGCH